jgi:coenzyme F420 hydrogenase subunit beta
VTKSSPTGRWASSWGDLVSQVVDPGRCSGCAGCVIACPKAVLTMSPSWVPRLTDAAMVDGDRSRCIHAERGCTVCARACPRFRLEEPDIEAIGYFDEGDVLGPRQAVLLVRATDAEVAAAGQDGGLGTAVMLYALEHGYVDAVLASGFDEEMRTHPRLARTRDELLQCAGSRYTYSANTLAVGDVAGIARLGLISTGCQVSIPAFAGIRGARKLAKRFALTVGLLCSKTFTDDLYTELLAGRYGVERHTITKVNIKGRLQVWHRTGSGEPGYLEVPLKECRSFTRAGCASCPDFTARHADLSLGGIGRLADTTLTIVRTDLGRELIGAMERDGWVTTADATVEDPDAIALIEKMARRQQGRWPLVESSARFR